MPRTKRDVVYNANSETVRKFFDRALEVDDAQKGVRSDISELNRQAEEAGVHSGCLSQVRRIAKLKPGRRGYAVALLQWYLDILSEQLKDPQLDIEDYIREVKARDEAAPPQGGEGIPPAPSGGGAQPDPTKVTAFQTRPRTGGNGGSKRPTSPPTAA